MSYKYEYRSHSGWISPIEEYPTIGDAMSAVCQLLNQNLATDARIVSMPDKTIIRTFDQIKAYCHQQSAIA